MVNLVELTITAFEQLTLRGDLRHMTLWMWGNILSHQQLLQKERAWCASCYEERLRAREPLYELLIWSFEAVTICIKHNIRLCDNCPHCNRQLPFLATDYHPGYRSNCRKWLGISSTTNFKLTKETVTKAEISQQFQFQHSIGELLSNSNKIEFPPSRQTFVANLIKLIDKHASSSINLFSDIVGIWSGTIRRLLGSESKLSLRNLCQICSRLNITPLDLLAEQGNEEYIKNKHIVLEDILSLRTITSWEEIEVKL